MKPAIFLVTLIFTIFMGCKDNSTNPTNGSGTLKLYLVDSPMSADSVIIFVNRVEVHKAGSDSTSGWTTINNTRRSFDLLQLRNGANAILGDSILSAGQYTQIRLILSENNYLVDNGIKYSLSISSGMETGIKLNHEFTIEPNGIYELMLDFNADQSIHKNGNSSYMLKPVIRITPKLISGTISGYVLPLNAQATVFTTIGADTVSTYLDSGGYFNLVALPVGTYFVEIIPGNTAYKDTILTGIDVMAGQNTKIDTVHLSNQ